MITEAKPLNSRLRCEETSRTNNIQNT